MLVIRYVVNHKCEVRLTQRETHACSCEKFSHCQTDGTII